MAIVVPAKGELKQAAKVLLDLAESPRDVRTVGNGLEFEVPDELADRYHFRDPVHTPAPVTDKTPDAAPARPVKRRGRAPRVDLEG